MGLGMGLTGGRTMTSPSTTITCAAACWTVDPVIAAASTIKDNPPSVRCMDQSPRVRFRIA
ncbi:MAG TPA: hypothetical protein DER64_05990 [Planctomycetaceae bacterium]|nr:hypothetical protein [Planctomycetaceae bacterium]